MYINCCDNTEGEYKKRMNHFKTIPKQKTIRRIKTKNKRNEITKTQELKGKEHNASVINQDKKTSVCLLVFVHFYAPSNEAFGPGQIREARPYHERDSSSKSDFNTQANQRKRKAIIYCELTRTEPSGVHAKSYPHRGTRGRGGGGG